MQYTGERMIPKDNKEDSMYLEHLARYIFATQFVEDKIVIDVASGSGYGTNMLAEFGAKSVTGVDISQEAVDFCNETYKRNNLTYVYGNVIKLPFKDKSIDVVVSMETIEHVNSDIQKQFFSEIKRVLKTDGILVMSTPNAEVTHEVCPQGNPYHVRELTHDEFLNLHKSYFKNTQFLYQEIVESSFVVKGETIQKIILSQENKDLNREKLSIVSRFNLDNILYFVCVSSNGSIPNITESVSLSNKKTWKQQVNASLALIEKDKELQRLYDIVADKDVEMQRLYETVFEKDEMLQKLHDTIVNLNNEMQNLRVFSIILPRTGTWRDSFLLIKKAIFLLLNNAILSKIFFIKNRIIRLIKKNYLDKRIAMICSTGAVGGAEKVFFDHVRILSKTFLVDVYFPLNGGFIADEIKKMPNVRVFIQEKYHAERLSYYKYLYLVQFIPDTKLIKKFNPSIKISFILHDSVLWIDELLKNKKAAKYIDHVFCISSLIKEKLLVSMPTFQGKTSVLFNGICFGNRSNQNIQERSFHKNGEIVFGYAGRFSWEKNVEGLILAFQLFHAKYPQSRLIIAGDISLKEDKALQLYKNKIIKLIENSHGIEYIGYQSNLRSFYKDIDILVMTSFIEGISVAALDALSFGIPVVSSNVGSMGEVIMSNKNGILFDLDFERENPFNNHDLSFSQGEINKCFTSMEVASQNKWDHIAIANESIELYGESSVENQLLADVNRFLKS